MCLILLILHVISTSVYVGQKVIYSIVRSAQVRNPGTQFSNLGERHGTPACQNVIFGHSLHLLIMFNTQPTTLLNLPVRRHKIPIALIRNPILIRPFPCISS